MGDRDEAVIGPMQEEHRPVDRLDVEAPRADEGEVVVEPAIDSVGQPVRSTLKQLVRELLREHRTIG